MNDADQDSMMMTSCVWAHLRDVVDGLEDDWGKIVID
jgi:hypothetical protein